MSEGETKEKETQKVAETENADAEKDFLKSDEFKFKGLSPPVIFTRNESPTVF